MSRAKYFFPLIVAAALGTALSASAEEAAGGYGGLVVSRLSSNESGYSPQPMAISGLAGYSFSPMLSMEARAGTGLGSDSVTVVSPAIGAVNVDVKVKSYFGGYLRATAPLSDNFNIYGLAGYADGKIEGSALGYTVSASDSGFSWFIGGEAKFGAQSKQGIAVEWGHVLSSTDSLSVVYRFRF